jgi:hypothetical protein
MTYFVHFLQFYHYLKFEYVVEVIVLPYEEMGITFAPVMNYYLFFSQWLSFKG